MTCYPRCNHMRVLMHDGRETCTWSEEWKLECEASAVLSMPLQQRRRYLWGYHNTITGKFVKGIKDIRGEAALAVLQNRIRDLFNARNNKSGDAQPQVARNSGS